VSILHIILGSVGLLAVLVPVVRVMDFLDARKPPQRRSLSRDIASTASGAVETVVTSLL
jgi:hypothetical protein